MSFPAEPVSAQGLECRHSGHRRRRGIGPRRPLTIITGYDGLSPAEYDAMPSVSAGWVLLRVPALLVQPCHINDLDSATVNSGIEGLFMGRSSEVGRIRPKSPQDIRLPNYPDHIQW
jgi:hypothetical protein